MQHNFILGPIDTDSVSICKSDGAPFTEAEQQALIDEINATMPKYIEFANDGYFPKVIVLKSKNYILFDGKKIKKKGSSLKSSKIEPALSEFMSELINALVYENAQLIDVYNKWVKEACTVKNIGSWCSKKTITASVLEPKRTNESKILDALGDDEHQMGDKVYVYFKLDKSLALRENWKGDHDVTVLVKKVYNTMKIFKNIIDIKEFPNYALKKNKKALELLILGENTCKS